MTGIAVTLKSPDAEAFAPYGRFVTAPDTPGERLFYSDTLMPHGDGSTPVLHVNHVRSQNLPLTTTYVERHPNAAQCFIPLDIARYVVMVMPSDAADAPDISRTMAFLMPPSMGVIYHPGVWHLGATVLDRPGHFTVLMWRNGRESDDEFSTIPQVTLIEDSE
jgi:ureidoglycolate lyase